MTERERRSIVDAVAAEQRAAGVTDPTTMVVAIRRAIERVEGLVTPETMTSADLAELAEVCFWAQDWHALDVVAIAEHPEHFDASLIAAARAQCATAISARVARLRHGQQKS